MDMESRRDGCGVYEAGRFLLDVGSFRAFGFAVLRQFFDPRPLSMEVDRVLSDGLLRQPLDGGGIRFQYVPMMTAETPASLSLLDRLGAIAETVFDRPVLPTRAKGVRYVSPISSPRVRTTAHSASCRALITRHSTKHCVT